jgi:hypothetical protein
MILLYERTAWGDYYTGNPTLYESKEYGTRQTLSDSNVYVLHCLFRSITSTSAGSALYCSSITYFLAESCSFFSCNTSNSYAAIFVSCGQSVLHNVCGNDCCTTSSYSYQFGYVQVSNTASSLNYFNYSSIVRCMNKNSDAHYVLGLGYGKICCPSVNISLNKCYRLSGIACWPTGDSNSVTCSLTYSSFTDNIATGYDCFWLNTGGANYEMKSCNILRNTQGTLSSDGTIYTSGNLMIEDSCILENRANNIFYQANSNYRITISNCTVDSTSNNGYLIIQNTVTKSFILALNHMSTKNCHSEYDSAGYLTPIIQTPSSSKRKNIYYTCQRLFYQPPTVISQIFLFFVSMYFSI